jgi:hypothetical protein
MKSEIFPDVMAPSTAPIFNIDPKTENWEYDKLSSSIIPNCVGAEYPTY